MTTINIQLTGAAVNLSSFSTVVCVYVTPSNIKVFSAMSHTVPILLNNPIPIIPLSGENSRYR